MISFNIADYAPDVQKYMLEERDAASYIMLKGEHYINWQGKVFEILEDSFADNIYVKCMCEDKFGKYIGYKPKIVLLS